MRLASAATTGFFGPRGLLARALPTYEERPAQARLSEAVADVLQDGGLLLAEAGTGTGTGDRAEVEDLPDGADFWREISAASENCIGQACPDFEPCWVTRMRQRALEADLVVVNHHLLCADLAVKDGSYGAVIPDYDTVILDEAHLLEDVATQYFGIQVSSHRLDDLSRDVL